MALKKLSGGFGGGNFISAPGVYVVKITETKNTLSREKQKPMIVLTFKNKEGLVHSEYFLKDASYRMKALNDIKQACGLGESASVDELIGKKLEFKLEAKPPSKEGTVFMGITEVGPFSDKAAPKEEAQQPSPTSDSFEDVPF